MSEQATIPAPAPETNKPPASVRWLATAGGLGRLPIAPGAWGSLGGLALAWLFSAREFAGWTFDWALGRAFGTAHIQLFYPMVWWLVLSAAGVWAAGSFERATGKKDPQPVVVDEVSGQWLTLLASPAFLSGSANWKSFLAGFILFRAFDMLKPFPARQAESLPGGWGIMADDWVAGAYAAACLWLPRAIGW